MKGDLWKLLYQPYLVYHYSVIIERAQAYAVALYTARMSTI